MARQWRAKANRWTALKPLARKNRREPTPAERTLWGAIRGGQIEGYRFRRQHAIDRFIVDFYCREASLVIEIDGASHEATAAEDLARQTMIEGQDLIVLRFSNEDVMERLDDVLEIIRLNLLDVRMEVYSDPPLSVGGEGAGGDVCASC